MGPDVFSYNAGISACEKGWQWRKVLSLLREMGEVKSEPDVVSYNAGISAFGKGGRWPQALSFLREMGEVKSEQSRTSSATMPASARARRASTGQKHCRC